MGSMLLRKAGTYILIAVPLVGLAGIAAIAKQNQDAAAQQGVDPVADAARKARQQKKDAPKPKKVFTNDDVPSGSSSNAGSGSSSSTAAPSGDSKNSANGDAAAGDKNAAAPGKNDEASWKSKFHDERAKLADAERELDILQRE